MENPTHLVIQPGAIKPADVANQPGIIHHVPIPKIFGRMCDILADVGPIAKDRNNTQQSYKFRGIDDVYEALQSILAKHRVFTTCKILSERSEERTTKSGSNLIYRILHIQWTFWTDDGSCVHDERIGEGMDSGDKASNKAMSVAHKYSFLQCFAIPTVEPKDPENDSPQAEASPDIYRATEDQKSFLRAAFARIPALTNPDKEAISTAMRNRHMRELDRAIQDHLAKKKA